MAALSGPPYPGVQDQRVAPITQPVAPTTPAPTTPATTQPVSRYGAPITVDIPSLNLNYYYSQPSQVQGFNIAPSTGMGAFAAPQAMNFGAVPGMNFNFAPGTRQ